jgi:predicted nucleic acid-binding protein
MVYVDTSVVVALFVPEAATPAIVDWFARIDEPLVAADWILTELASALSIKERTGALSAAAAHAVWGELEAFCGTGLPLVPVSRQAYGRAARLARDAPSGLRAGDALHLAVALEIGASRIATTDALLDANARNQGLEVVTFSAG